MILILSCINQMIYFVLMDSTISHIKAAYQTSHLVMTKSLQGY